MNAGAARMWAPVVAMAIVATGCSVPAEPEPADVVPEAIAEDATLLAATSPDFPPVQFRAPFEFQGVQAGEVTGFEVDLVEAVADELGLSVQWVDVPFEQVLEQVSTGAADVAASAITVTDERSADFTFVTFFKAGTQWAVREPNVAGVRPNDACGARVAVQSGTVAADDLDARSAACEQAGDDPIDIREYENQSEVTAALIAGVVNAFAADAPAVRWAIRQSGNPSATSSLNTNRLVPAGPPFDVASYGWAVNDPDLAQALLDGLQAVVDSGEYLEILQRWGVDEGALEPAEIAVVEQG
jgi:polar amino acid transport system substrate-binding protein